MTATSEPVRSLEGIPSDPSVPMRFLPKERYLSQEFYDQETNHLWTRVWQMACREQEIQQPGEYVEYKVLDQSILVVRQRDGGIKALFNACAHRGRPLGSGSGQVEQFRCPYHAWSFNLDGSVKSIPSPEEFACGGRYDLGECLVDTWGGFVFINLDPDAPPLMDYLGPVVETLAPYRFENMVATKYVTNKFPANWKSAIDPFIEAYHTVGSHPQLLMSLDDVNSSYELMGIHSRMLNPAFTASPRAGEVEEQDVWDDFLEEMRGIGMDIGEGLGELPPDTTAQDHVVAMFEQMARAQGLDLSRMTDEHMRNVNCVMIFPNLCLQTMATEMFLWRARPFGPGRCELDQIVMHPVPEGSPPQPPPTHEVYENFRDYDTGLTLFQDFSNIWEVHAGMQQQSFSGTYCASKQEMRIAHMHDVIDRYIEGKPFEQMP
jgi:phenylpropionate dioxygenase-like ring-hydroxylating dioxygenase large terminal subunit